MTIKNADAPVDDLADTRLGLDPADLESDFRDVGLTDIRREVLTDTYVVEHPGGRKIRLPLFLVRGRKAG